jgi:hypothetical protein
MKPRSDFPSPGVGRYPGLCHSFHVFGGVEARKDARLTVLASNWGEGGWENGVHAVSLTKKPFGSCKTGLWEKNSNSS